MKVFIAIAAFLVIGTVAAQSRANAGPSITDYLIRRGQILQQHVERHLFELDQQGRRNLGNGLANLLVEIKAVELSLYGNNFTEDLESKEKVEQEFTQLEKRVAEELVSIQMAKQAQLKN